MTAHSAESVSGPIALRPLLVDLWTGTHSERGSASRRLVELGYVDLWGQLDLPPHVWKLMPGIIA